MIKSLIVSAVLVGIANSIALAQFGPSELTKEDVISLYNVPIERNPYNKFEWVFQKPQYIRFVIEEAPPGTQDWHVIFAVPYNLAVRRAMIIWGIRDEMTATSKRNEWRLDLRLGGEADDRHGWTGSSLVLRAPLNGFQSVTNKTDPSDLYRITANDFNMRFRLESADKLMELIWPNLSSQSTTPTNPPTAGQEARQP
jgi:hypothetical protein